MNSDKLLPLPSPDSDELHQLVAHAEVRRIYSYLFDRRDNPPTEVEISKHLEELSGEAHSQRGRRKRELYPFFEITKVWRGGRNPRYLLVGMKPTAHANANDERLTRTLRAEVLQPQRCAMCGRTPLADHVKLEVDHKLPRDWGGRTVVENLQPLCSECNSGKKARFATFSEHEDKIRAAANFDDPRQRLGELLRAFGVGVWVSANLLGAVANAKEPQDDWHRRLRELRTLGWQYKFTTQRSNGRVQVYYALVRSSPWPSDIPGVIKRGRGSR